MNTLTYHSPISNEREVAFGVEREECEAENDGEREGERLQHNHSIVVRDNYAYCVSLHRSLKSHENH